LEIQSLVIGDLYSNNLIKTLARFQRDTTIQVSGEEFERLRNLATNAKLKYAKSNPKEKRSQSIFEFLQKKEKSSKQFRIVLMEYKHDFIPHNMIKFSDSTQTIINLENSKKLNSCWTLNTLGNSTRTFLFKLHNNTLGLNVAVAHFVRGHSDNCTFCDITENPEPTRENCLHLFYQCETSERLINGIFTHYQSINTIVTRQELFVRFSTGNIWRDEVFFIISNLALKYIWDCKQRKCLPHLQVAIEFINIEISTLNQLNKKFRENLARSGIDNELFNVNRWNP